ncbi:hypothetical protein BKA59DRAFT_392316, partial [Fusarium tricinctum]
ALPGFWIFLYYVSPITYLIGGVTISGLLGNLIVYLHTELAVFLPLTGKTCRVYIQLYLK